MAEAKEIGGLDCNAPAVEWATKVLRVRLAEVIDLRAAKDFLAAESVHDTRVAIRRLRSTLRDFSPLLKKRPLCSVRKNLKQLADALGAVRDQDVAIIALKKLVANLSNEQIKEGIEKFLVKRETQREQNRVTLIKILTKNDSATLESDFEKAIDRAIKNNSLTFNQAGRAAVGESLKHFLELGAASLYDPFNAHNLHELRIAAKRLRYALELFAACWGESIKMFSNDFAEMQSALGEVHDCDVWIDGLGKLLRQEKSATNKSERQAAIWLLSEFAKKRTKYYRNALKLWGEWQENDFAQRMQAVINSID